MRKLILAIVVAYILLMGTDYLVHDIWLMPDYTKISSSFRPQAQIMHRFWAMAIGEFLFTALFAYIYQRGAEMKPWVGQGIRYAILMTFFTVIPYSLSEYDVYNIPHLLAVKWMVAGFVQLLILGLVVAGICQKETA
jgi:ABC-type glycerol-3-phosphate transport system permease component